jgi:hypothetical protein
MMRTPLGIGVAAVAIGFWAIPAPAYAYIDPGIGSLIFQSLLAGLVTVAALWGGLRAKLAALFARRSDPEERGESDARPR